VQGCAAGRAPQRCAAPAAAPKGAPSARQLAASPARAAASTLHVRNWFRARPGCDAPEALRRAAEAAAAGAQRTAALAAGAGRASYVPGAQYQGHPDPGALGVAV
jgi:hypothetical protein